MSVLFYLLESNLYLLIMYGFYRIILHRETFHQLNRIYLLSAVIISFTIPLLQVKYEALSSREMAYTDISKLTNPRFPVTAKQFTSPEVQAKPFQKPDAKRD